MIIKTDETNSLKCLLPESYYKREHEGDSIRLYIYGGCLTSEIRKQLYSVAKDEIARCTQCGEIPDAMIDSKEYYIEIGIDTVANVIDYTRIGVNLFLVRDFHLVRGGIAGKYKQFFGGYHHKYGITYDIQKMCGAYSAIDFEYENDGEKETIEHWVNYDLAKLVKELNKKHSEIYEVSNLLYDYIKLPTFTSEIKENIFDIVRNILLVNSIEDISDFFDPQNEIFDYYNDFYDKIKELCYSAFDTANTDLLHSIRVLQGGCYMYLYDNFTSDYVEDIINYWLNDMITMDEYKAVFKSTIAARKENEDE